VGPVLTGCGESAASSPTSPGHSCHSSPPDVLDLRSVPLGDANPFAAGVVPPTPEERDLENKYLYAHWGVATDGIYGNGHFYMGFTDDAQKHLAELRRLMPDPSRVRAYCAPYSKASLGTTMDRLGHDFQSLHAQGIDLTSWAEGGLDGHVDITVRHLTPDFEKRLRDRYGAIIGTVRQGEAIAN
jgi:hypothetical protein